MNYKYYFVENEKPFGKIIVTNQTFDGAYISYDGKIPVMHIQSDRNLVQETFETPDFMTLNRLMTKNSNKRRKKNSTSSSGSCKSKIDSTNNYSTIHNHQYHHIKEGCVKKQRIYPLPVVRELHEEIVVSSLVDQLLSDIYRYPRDDRERSESESTVSSFRPRLKHRYLQRTRLQLKSKDELSVVLETLQTHINHAGGLLIRQLRRKDYLCIKRDRQYDVITAHLQAYSNKTSEDTRMRFSLTPQPGESGFTQWLDAMKMVARLSGGIPQEFRKRLWLTLAERHLEQRGVDWTQAEKLCFNEWTNPDDEELGIQIVKDLHRTGCSLFCGAAGRDNQAVLRRVLLGFARWNKSVGYCQGLNVLAALVLQVMDRAEASAVKVMIYLIEGVLPEGYFADNLRGLSVDMAVFRDLLRMRLPKLSRHLETLQCDTKDKATGSSYEPPLTNVFTMQWFLTLFCHCLPQDTVLRVWDLIFLEGDEVLLRTALAIWEGISDRIMPVTSADEFYSIMGVLTREMLEFTDTNNLIKMIVNMGPLNGVTDLREKHRYNITPWARRLSDDEDTDTEDDDKLAVVETVLGISQRIKKDRRSIVRGTMQSINSTGDREKLALDISTLKQQYSKLRERQRQAHIILSGKSRAACARQTIVPTSASQAMNHLLVGKSALVSTKTRQLGPPPGTIPPKTRITSIHSPRNQNRRDKQSITLHWKDTKKPKETKNEPAVTDEGDSELIKSLEDISVSIKSSLSSSSLSRCANVDSDSDSTSTELCDEPDRFSDSEEPTSISDYCVTVTDDEKSTHQSASLISFGTPSIKSSRNFTKELSLSDKNISVDIKEIETSESIAKITDQIRRLSAGEDDKLLEVYHSTSDANEDIDIAEVTSMDTSSTITGQSFMCEEVANEDSSRTPGLDGMNFLSRDNAVEMNADEKIDSRVSSINENYVTEATAKETLFSLNEQCSKLNASSAINFARNTETMASNSTITTTEQNNIQLMYSSSHSFDISENECESHAKVPISARSNTIDSTITYSYDSQNSSAKLDNIDSIYYSKSYVIGHLPISSITIDKKLGNSLDTNSSSDSMTALNAKIGCLSTETNAITYETTEPTLSLDYHSPHLMNVYAERKTKSPRSPESGVSVSSGETMGPDSKVSSIATTPRTPFTSDLCKFGGDKSGCSSVSSESKTLTLMSMDSNDIGQSISKLNSRSDITRPSFDKSTPSTPISTDSLRNKSELVSPSKLITSSSGDSYNNSPGKVKYTERSYSSGLQSPISANSIKYIANYKRQDDLYESPVDLISVTSPFYPIVNPNQKSPSPNRTPANAKNIAEFHDIASEKMSLSGDSTNTIVYSFDEMPKVFKASSVDMNKKTKNNDDYDSARPFETELAETLSSTRLKTEKDLSVDLDERKLVEQIDTKVFDTKIEEGLFETENTVSPLSHGKYDIRVTTHLDVCKVDKKNDDDYSPSSRARDSTKLFERSCSSLDKRFSEMKLSTSSEDLLTSKKRSSDILADLRHLEANTIETTVNAQTVDTIMTRKTGYDWEDLKNLEARRQDNFSDSASEFSKYRLDIPSISVSTDGRRSYIIEPKIQMDANSDSILKNYTRKKDNGEPDDGKESKLGVWTKVKPRKIGENGRRSSSDRALKIIQENSVILQKILTCQAKKCLPDLEEISKEITISPINEEISKIFSPILEKMGLNEHEINEELARINFKDFDQMTVASGSEFDAKINDELSKLSLIDDNEGITHLDIDEMIEDDYLNRRDALIDKQINEELSKVLANYEHETSPLSLRDKGSLSQNPSEIEPLDLSSVSTNVFSYQSSNDSTEAKSDVDSIQDPVVIQTEKFSQYTERSRSSSSGGGGGGQNYDAHPIKYELQSLSPKSDIDIYRELEKLDKISSARVFPSFTSSSGITPTFISTNAYTTESPSSFSQVHQSTIEYSAEPEKPFESAPLKSPHHTPYKPYDFEVSRISPLKLSSSNLYSRSYQSTGLDDGIDFNERNANTSRNYEYESKRKILTKDNLEFRVRYDDENLPNQTIKNDDFSIEPYQTNLSDLDRGASYYDDESPRTLKTSTINNDRELINSTVSPLNYSYDKITASYEKKFVSVSPAIDNYVYSMPPTANDYEKKNYQLIDDQLETSYSGPSRRRDIHLHSPNYPFVGREFVASSTSNYACSKVSPSLDTAGASESISVITSELVDEAGVLKYSEVPISRDTIAYRKTSMTLGPLDTANRIYSDKFHETPSPKSQFNPFPARTTTRRPKELGLKLGLYSPSSSGSTGQSKRS